MASPVTQHDAIAQRRKFVDAFNGTQLTMWQEQIVLLGVIDTGMLHGSVAEVRCDHDDKVTVVTLQQSFLEYGIYQDYGTGREVPKGNPGDIGHDKVRQRRPWMSKKLFASVMNLKEMFTDSMGREFCGIVADALNDKKMRAQLRNK